MPKIAIMGFGVVGSGVYDVINANRDSIAEKTGSTLEVGHILDIRDFDSHPAKHLFTKDFDDILNDSDVEIVAEVIGGVNPAYTFTKQCLQAGKSVVTSNKELVAKHGTELIALAKENGCSYLFEASVGGGIPLIDPLCRAMSGNKVNKICGILNGTTNYILTQMATYGSDFKTALEGAQKNGYAEANPAADIEGIDACRKIAILSSVAWGAETDCNKIKTTGISDITSNDTAFAKQMGFTVKLIAYSSICDNRVSALVEPMFVSSENPLYFVNDVFNAGLIDGNATGNVMFYGKGAGKDATASAVVADIISICTGVAKVFPVTWKKSDAITMGDEPAEKFAYYVRCNKADADAVKNIFDIKQAAENGDEAAFITGEMSRNDFEAKSAQVNLLKAMRVMY